MVFISVKYLCAETKLMAYFANDFEDEILYGKHIYENRNFTYCLKLPDVLWAQG